MKYDTPIKMIYIAGPFRAPTPFAIEMNIRRAEEMAYRVWQLGSCAICPHTLGRITHGNFEDPFLLDAMKLLLSRCDAVLLMPNWQDSKGTQAEVVLAQEMKLPIHDTIHDLMQWLDVKHRTPQPNPNIRDPNVAR